MSKQNRFSYEGRVGRWWLQHSMDNAHRRAYRQVADFIRASFTRDPGTIVDYACGPGNLLALLSARFPNSKLIGLDASLFLLGFALRRFGRLPAGCTERISLIKTPLPNMKVLREKADLAIFCFPNMTTFPEATDFRESRECLAEGDRRIAETLSLASEPGDLPVKAAEGAASRYALEEGRCISLNLRRLLVRDGICVRVEYATMQRHELSLLALAHVAYEEGSLDTEVEGRMPRQWFRLVASAYFRSRVVEDVYEQTGDERDRNGGYLITVLRAV
jgi:SAM-dependent methyltransferase